jgi:hypothetical protein
MFTPVPFPLFSSPSMVADLLLLVRGNTCRPATGGLLRFLFQEKNMMYVPLSPRTALMNGTVRQHGHEGGEASKQISIYFEA